MYLGIKSAMIPRGMNYFLYSFLQIILINIASAAAAPVVPSLHFDGVYISKPDHTDGEEDTCEFIRFYPNGTAITVSSYCDRSALPEIMKWLTPENAGPEHSGVSLGMSSIAGNKLSFTAESKEGKVSYQGEIFDDHLDLNTYSFINNYRGKNSFSFVKVDDTSVGEVKEEEEENSPKLASKLKGTDFELTTQTIESNGEQRLTIRMNTGKPVANFTSVSGEKYLLENITYSPADSFKLKNIIPGAQREQLVVRGNTLLTRGEGQVKSYSIYRIDETGITELLNLITKRNFDGQDNRPSLYLTATVKEKIENNKLVIEYRYKGDDMSKYRVIRFKWNGSAFVDAKGSYKKIQNKYRP